MIITLRDLYKSVGGEVLFESLNMEWNENQRIGLVGRNGSGKSTLFRVITKEEPMDGGDLFIRKGLTIGYLKQIPADWEYTGKAYLETAFQNLLSLGQEMKELENEMLDPEKIEKAMIRYGEIQERYAQRGGYKIDASIRQVAHGLNVAHLLEHSFASLSGGEKTKLGLAKLLLENPDLLLLDEPTNHLDLQAIEWLESYLQQYKGTVCIISHDRSFLDQVVTEIMDLEAGEIHMYKGNYTSFEKQKEEKLLAEFHQYEEQQKMIKKMKEATRRLRQWANEANPPNPKLFKKAKSMEKALERIEKIDRPLIDPKKMNLSLQAEGRTGKDVFVAEGLTKAYGNAQVLNGIDLHVRYKDRLAIVGANGSGKSTLLRLLLKKEKPDGGELKRAPLIQIGYLPQHPLQGADREQRMVDYFRDYIRVTEGEARKRLAGFMFYGYDVFRKIRHLSGGEQMRLKLAVFMYQNIQVLILDEPTNHLDIDSQEVLEKALTHFTGTVIGVSHDRYFLKQCFTHTAYLLDGKLHRFIGNYDETRHHWVELLSEKEENQEKKRSTERIRETAPIPEESLEEKIDRLEKQMAAMEKELEEKEDVAEQGSLQAEKERLEAEVERLYEEWMSKQ